MEEFTEMVIDAIKQYPVLYAISHPDHRIAYKRELAWRKVQKMTGVHVPKLKTKWKNLRDTYKKSKQLQLTPSGHTVQKFPNWIWGEKMSFMDSNNIEDSFNLTQEISLIEDPLSEIKMECLERGMHEENEAEAEVETHQNEIQEAKNIMNVKRRRLVQNQAYRLKKLAKIGDPVEVACDRIDMEFLGIADTFKKFSVRKQATVRLEIAKIITQAQLDELDD